MFKPFRELLTIEIKASYALRAEEFHDVAASWTGTLPTTQEYVVDVIPRGGYLVIYILTVTIS
jgi:hypothetical protein